MTESVRILEESYQTCLDDQNKLATSKAEVECKYRENTSFNDDNSECTCSKGYEESIYGSCDATEETLERRGRLEQYKLESAIEAEEDRARYNEELEERQAKKEEENQKSIRRIQMLQQQRDAGA